MVNLKFVVVGLVIGLGIGFVIGLISGRMYSVPTPSSSDNTFKQVTVVSGQMTTITFGDSEYYFTYTPKGTHGFEDNMFTVTTPMFATKTLIASQGKVYAAYGIQIVVSQVASDYVILMIKSTVPT